MTKLRQMLLIIMTLTLLVSSFTSVSLAAPRTLRIGFGTSEEHPVFRALTEFKRIVEEESNGSLRVQLFPNSILGSDRELLEQITAGALDMYQGSTAVLSSYVPEFMVLDFPFLWPSSEIQDMVLDGEFGTWLADLAMERNVGFKVLNYWDAGFRQLTSNRPVHSPSDLVGQKIRLMENPLHMATFSALGSTVVTVPFGELYGALQQRVADGQENPIPIIHAMRYNEVQKYLNLTGHLNTPLCLAISSKTWEALSQDEQALIVSASERARDLQRIDNRASEADLIADLQSKGMTVVELTPEQLAEFQEKVQPVYDRFVDEVGRDVFNRLMSSIEDARN